MIQGHCVANEVDRALLCLNRMIEKGCNADAAVLGVLIGSFLGQKRIDDAYKLLVEIVSKHGTSPRHGTYAKLIDNLLGIGKLEAHARCPSLPQCRALRYPSLFSQPCSKEE